MSRPLLSLALALLAGCSAPAFPPGETVTVAYRTVGDLTLYADVSVPETPPSPAPTPYAVAPRPVVVWLHGGGLVFGSRTDLRPSFREALLDAGWVVVAPDYRLAPETPAAGAVADVEAALAWVRQEGPGRFGADPKRVAVVGHSAGAFLALAAAARTAPDRPQAVVSFYGYGDLSDDWATSPSPFYTQGPPVSEADAQSVVGTDPLADAPSDGGPGDRFQFYLRGRQQGSWAQDVTGTDPTADSSWRREYEPVLRITPAFPATLLLHGYADQDVPFDRTEALAERLREHNVLHEVVADSTWGHAFEAFLDAEAERAVLDRVVGFLDRTVRAP